ncbi:MAG: hypothetical protein R6V35_02845 [Candidatus Nanohaloarchaea archaeon]
MKLKLTALTAIILLSSGLAAANITFNHDQNIIFQTPTEFNDNVILNSNIQGFPLSSCSGDQAATGINDDGTVQCSSIDGSTSGLSDVLEVDNTANQSIDLGNNDLNEVGNVELRQPQAGDPVMSYRMQEGDDYGAYLEYDSQFDGDTNDNRVVIGTENDGNEYDVISAERDNGLMFAHRPLDMQTNPISFDNTQIKIGDNIDNQGDSSIAMGDDVYVGHQNSIGIGRNVSVNNNVDFAGSAVAIGHSAQTSANEAVAIGSDAYAANKDTIALGEGAEALQNEGVAISAATSDGQFSFALGYGAETSADQAYALGKNASASGSDAYALGEDADASNADAYAIGDEASASGNDAYALGDTASASGTGSFAFGMDAISDQDYTARFGSNATPYDVDVTGDLNVDGELTGVSTGGGSASGLSEVLEENNVANQTIEFEDNIQIGDEDTGTEFDAIAIGKNATVEDKIMGNTFSIAIGEDTDVNSYSTAVGWSAEAEDYSAVFGRNSKVASYAAAFGEESQATSSQASAFGYYSKATGSYASALGSYTDATAEGSVAIGYHANAPNSYEATLGNLQGQELDLNVTGNATVHQDADVQGDLNVGGELTGVSTGGAPEGLSETLAAGNVANQSIEFSNGIEIGESTTESPNTDDIAIGNGAGAVGTSSNPSIAIGSGVEAFDAARVSIGGNTDAPGSGGTGGTEIGIDSVAGTDASAFGSSAVSSGQSSVSLGALSEASAEGSVAIGEYANAPNSYEATFGNLNGEELDLNVTGNATIHGEGGLDMPSGVVIGTGADVRSEFQDIAIGKDAKAGSNANTNSDIAIGKEATSEGGYSAVLGYDADNTGYAATALGYKADSSGTSAIALGRETKSSGDFSNSIGWRAESSGSFSTAIGGDSDNSETGASAGGEGSVAIGADSVSNSDYTARFGSDSQPYDVDVTGNLSVDGQIDEKNVREVSYSSGHTAWSSGLSTEEVNRFGTNSTESVEIERLDVQVKGGGSNSNFEVEVYDAGSGTVLGSTTAGTPINDVGKGSEGSDVTVRVTNSDGSDVTASITVSGQVVE